MRRIGLMDWWIGGFLNEFAQPAIQPTSNPTIQ
jgi:hypothetical protein